MGCRLTGIVTPRVFDYTLHLETQMVVDVEGDVLSSCWWWRGQGQLEESEGNGKGKGKGWCQLLLFSDPFLQEGISALTHLHIGDLYGCEEVLWQLCGDLEDYPGAVQESSCMLYIRTKTKRYIPHCCLCLLLLLLLLLLCSCCCLSCCIVVYAIAIIVLAVVYQYVVMVMLCNSPPHQMAVLAENWT